MIDYLSALVILTIIVQGLIAISYSIVMSIVLFIIIAIVVNYKDWKYYSIGYNMLPYYKYTINGSQVYGIIRIPNDPQYFVYTNFIWFLDDDTIKIYEKKDLGGIYLNHSISRRIPWFANDPYEYYWHKKCLKWLKQNIDIEKLEIY